MKLKDYISFHRPALEKTLLRYLESKLVEFADKPLYVQSINKIKQTVTSGELIRGTLILLAYESRKNTITPDAMKLAASMELFHAGLLIHDDIMDDDHLRRGKPTVLAQSILDGKKFHANNPENYGNAMAICIGDLALFMAYELIGSLEDTSQSLRILQTSALELQKVGFAQITDIHFGLSDFEPSEEEIIDLYKFKTARYSFSLPLRIGGMLAGYDDITLQNFESFGESLGIAFQIKDDELGIYGDEKIMGKPVGSDIRENKKTLFRHALFRSVDEAVRPELELIYGSKKLTEEDMTIIREYLKKHNVLSLVQKVREDKSIAAKNILNNIDIPQKYKLVFADLVDFSNDRDK